MSHLTPGEFVDAVDGTLDPARRAHLDDCERCRREAAALSALIHDAAGDALPEPSPLFWEHFSARVRAAVRAQAPADASWQWWLRWPAIVPLGVLATLVLAIVTTVPGSRLPAAGLPPEAAVAADIDLLEEAAADDAEWHALAELVGLLDWDAAGAVGLTVGPGDVDRALDDLTDDERRELSALIAGELARRKS